MVFAYDGELNIDQDTRLKDPKFRLINCRCDLRTNKAHLMVEFTEGDGIFPHGREYEFTAASDGVTKDDLITVIVLDPVLNLFTLQP